MCSPGAIPRPAILKMLNYPGSFYLLDDLEAARRDEPSREAYW